MDKLSFEEREIFALHTVVTHMIAVMSDDQKARLKTLASTSMDGMIAADAKNSHHFADIKKSVMEIMNISSVKSDT
nr:hypothetical protein [uncultured Enterobacter sp.]